MKTLYAVGGLGISFLGVIGVLGWILAVLIAIVIPGGSLLMLGAHYFNRRRGSQSKQVVSMGQKSPVAAA
jgi:hypothetical protein